MPKKTGLVASVLAVVLGASATVALAAPGDLDTSFSGDGIIVTDFAGGGDDGAAVVVDADGKIVVAGDASTGSTRDVVVLRYLPDGSLDPGFSNDGMVTTSIGTIASVSDAAIDSAGRIVVATLDSTLLRYQPNGELDGTFGSSGKAETTIQQVRSIAIDADDRIVVAGDFHVARYLSDGTIDSGFGLAGVIEVTPSFLVWAVAIDSQDRIVVGGSDFIDLDVYDGVVARFLSDGAPDLSFANAGVAILQRQTSTLWVQDLAIDSDDAILLAVSDGNVHKAPVMRLTSAGGIDLGFATDGIASIQHAEQASVGSVAVDHHGNIVAAGAIEAGANDFDLLVVRYRPDGSPDTGFSDDGIATADAGNNRAGAGALAIDAAGGITVAGSTSGDQTSDLVVARFEGYRPDDRFVDDDDTLFENDIEAIERAGITKGCNPPANDRYCPNEPVTRGQMAAFLVRALGYTDPGTGDLFTDDDDSIFEDDIDILGTAGITRGCNPPANDRFCPNQSVTRGQMAAFLVRALELE